MLTHQGLCQYLSSPYHQYNIEIYKSAAVINQSGADDKIQQYDILTILLTIFPASQQLKLVKFNFKDFPNKYLNR